MQTMLSWALLPRYPRARSELQVDSFHISIAGLCGHQLNVSLTPRVIPPAPSVTVACGRVEGWQDQTDDGEEIRLEGVSGINSVFSASDCMQCLLLI